MKNEIMKIGDAAKYIGRSAQTLRRYDAAGILKPCSYGPSDTRYYKQEDLDAFMSIGKSQIVTLQHTAPKNVLRSVLESSYEQPAFVGADDAHEMLNTISEGFPDIFSIQEDRHPALYCRVNYSGDVEKDQSALQEQTKILEEYAIECGENTDELIVFGDIGSGAVFDNRGFISLLDAVSERGISVVYIYSQEKLSRFAFPMVDLYLKAYSTTISIMRDEVNIDDANADISEIIRILQAQVKSK